ncbi:MAG: hypothetical protein ACK5IQ_10085 [Bacteroidales bacterium]
MGSSLCAITNSKLTGKETEEDWVIIMNKLIALDMKRAINFDGSVDNNDWEYYIIDDKHSPVRVEYDSPCPIDLSLSKSVGILSTIYRYYQIYEIYGYGWLDSFRQDLYNVVKIAGGTEIIYLPDSYVPQFAGYFDMAYDGEPYDLIKQKLIEEFGQPATDYSKLDSEKLDYDAITEFILDDFADLKKQE